MGWFITLNNRAVLQPAEAFRVCEIVTMRVGVAGQGGWEPGNASMDQLYTSFGGASVALRVFVPLHSAPTDTRKTFNSYRASALQCLAKFESPGEK